MRGSASRPRVAGARTRIAADLSPALVTQPEIDRGVFERQDERRVDIRLKDGDAEAMDRGSIYPPIYTLIYSKG